MPFIFILLLICFVILAERWSGHDAWWGSSWKLNPKNFGPNKLHKIRRVGGGVKTKIGRVSGHNNFSRPYISYVLTMVCLWCVQLSQISGCGRPNRPHYGCCPSVRLSLTGRAANSKTKTPSLLVSKIVQHC